MSEPRRTRTIALVSAVATMAALGGVWGLVSLAKHATQGAHAGGEPTAAFGPVATPSLEGREGRGPHDAAESGDDDRTYSFRLPLGKPAELSCAEARRVIAQVRTELAYEPDAVSPHALAAGTTDWLDPHALWSAAPDSPIAALIEDGARAMTGEIEARPATDARGECPTATAIGAALVAWVGELRGRFDRARAEASDGDAAGAMEEIPFDDFVYKRPARAFADDLGARVGAFVRAYGAPVERYADAARDRFFPEMSADEWGRAVLAAAVRAYVPLVDPHGAWAPLDEEESVYEVDLASHPPVHLWEKSERTAIGVKLGEGATPPLEAGDLLLSIASVATAGLPLEQLDQLSYAAAEGDESPIAVVLRAGERGPIAVKLDTEPPAASLAVEEERLPTERVRYGEGDVAVVSIHDVRDDLGDLVARTIAHERGAAGPRALAGVVLDLRGNGGGSTDGAIAAIGLFLPGAPLFPMRRRDGTIETDRAPEPPIDQRWSGPLATLVDGDTASAAEMIAGALAVYHRGPVVGAATYGKGCAQEYVDDDAHAGVLRLTTLLYALPDGQAVQRVGIAPTIGVTLAPTEGEREATLAHAAPSWRGPDVRDRRVALADEAWSAHGGNLGPCRDADVCRALRALGGAAAKSVRATRGGGRR